MDALHLTSGCETSASFVALSLEIVFLFFDFICPPFFVRAWIKPKTVISRHELHVFRAIFGL